MKNNRKMSAITSTVVVAVLAVWIGFTWPILARLLQEGQSSAETPNTMSKEEFEDRVRDYLLENPEVLAEALGRLEQRELEAQRETVKSIVKIRADDLYGDPDSPVAGNADGNVALVEFFDYNCPYCRRVTPTVEKAIAADPELRVVYKEFPILGAGSIAATKAALAARQQNKYAEIHDAFMAHKGKLDESSVIKVAASIGLDIEQLKTDMEDDKITKAISRNHDLARALHITGTPGFIIGDQLIPGAASLGTLQDAIQKVRKERQR